MKAFLYLTLFLVLATLSFAHVDPYAPQDQGMSQGMGQGFAQGGAFGLPQYGFTEPYTAMTSPRVSYLNGVVSPYPSDTYLRYCDYGGGSQSQVRQGGEAALVFSNPGHFENPNYVLDREETQVEHELSNYVDESGNEYTIIDPATQYNEIEYSQDLHHYTDLYKDYTHIDDETQTTDHYYESIDPISPERFKQLSLADQFEYRQGHHRLFASTPGGGNAGNRGIQPCYDGAFVHTLEERLPRVDFRYRNEMRGGRNDFNSGPMEVRNRGGFTPGAMEMRNRGGFTPGGDETRNRGGFTPGGMEIRNRGGFIPGADENRNRGGFIPGPMEVRDRTGFITGPMENRDRTGFFPGPMEFRNRFGFVPGDMNFARIPAFIGGVDLRNPKNHFIFSDP